MLYVKSFNHVKYLLECQSKVNSIALCKLNRGNKICFLTHILIYKLHRGKIQLHRGTHFYFKKSVHANFFFISTFNGQQIILLTPPWCKDFKNVIRFKIRLPEGAEKN